MTSTVLFALHTVGVLGVLGVLASSQAGLGPAKVLTLIGWLIGLGAVVALWQRPVQCLLQRAGVGGPIAPSRHSLPWLRGSFTDSPPSPGHGSARSHRERGDDRAIADVLVVTAIAFFVAAMLSLIWALGRI